jgi:hypothetical protein
VANGPAPKDAAKKRITTILAWEVSIVDRPANQRPFLMMKSDGAPPATPVAAADAPAATPAGATPPAAPPASAPAVEKGKFPPLNSQVRQAVLDAGVAGAEKLRALVSAVAEAPVDDTAATPPELMKLLEESTSEIKGVLEKIAPAAAPTPDPQQAPVAAAADGGVPAAAPAAAPAGTTDIAKAIADAVSAAKADLKKDFDGQVAELKKSHAGEIAVLKTSVAANESRLALGKAAGGGNAAGGDGTGAPPPPAQTVGLWKGDLAAEVTAERADRAKTKSG